MSIGEIIKEKRKQLGLSQRALAKKLGVPNVSLAKWECGMHIPNIYALWDLADFFGCTIDELCGRDPTKGETI